jgi:hypothetical protein
MGADLYLGMVKQPDREATLKKIELLDEMAVRRAGEQIWGEPESDPEEVRRYLTMALEEVLAADDRRDGTTVFIEEPGAYVLSATYAWEPTELCEMIWALSEAGVV